MINKVLQFFREPAHIARFSSSKICRKSIKKKSSFQSQKSKETRNQSLGPKLSKCQDSTTLQSEFAKIKVINIFSSIEGPFASKKI